jgi:hypothetical protein
MPVTQHFGSHVEIIRKFLEWKVVAESVGDLVRVRVGASARLLENLGLQYIPYDYAANKIY